MRKNVHPQCPNASNPFHTTCSETCMQRISNMGKKQTEAKVSGSSSSMVMFSVSNFSLLIFFFFPLDPDI